MPAIKFDTKDAKLLIMGGSRIVGGSGGWEAPPFGYSDRDFVHFNLYDAKDTYVNHSGKIVDFKDNNLHVIGYSESIDAWLEKDEFILYSSFFTFKEEKIMFNRWIDFCYIVKKKK